jgi:hypothetical protein
VKNTRHKKISKLELTHLPYARTLQEYQTALDRYLKQAARTKGVKAVYQVGSFGSVSVPGISDIDLVLIVDEKITNKEISKLSLHNLSEDDQDIFLHNPWVVTVQTSAIFFETNYITNLVKVYGENCGLKIQDGLSNTYQRWALTLEYAPWYIFCIQDWLSRSNVDVRWALPVLRSIKYLLEINSDLKTRFYMEWQDHADGIELLCDNWFNFSDNELAIMLESVLQKAWKIVVDLVWTRDAELTTTSQFIIERERQKPGNLAYSSNESYIVKEEKPKDWKSNEDATLFYPLPPSCLLMLDVYQTTGGLLAKFLSTLSPNCWSGLQPNTEFEFYLAKRAKLINEHIEFLNSKNIDFGHTTTPFVFNPYVLKNKSIVTRTKKRIWMLLPHKSIERGRRSCHFMRGEAPADRSYVV